MNKKTQNIFIALIIIFLGSNSLFSDVFEYQGHIKRLTHSGNDFVHYPCLSDDGEWILYVQESKSGEKPTKSLRVLDISTGREKELFWDRKMTAPRPYENVSLLVGSKPPVLSGNGRVAVFILSLDQPESILDHYLALINTDGSDFKIISFPIESLQEKNWKALDFKSNEWERISNYAVNSDGSRVACVMKGHLGPIRYGNASAIIMVDTLSGEQKTILAHRFNGKQWEWTSFPSRPLLGGAWAFGMSSSGDRILFGAQSSEDKLDYDLYLSGWEGTQFKRITDFHDRWFSLAELGQDGKKAVFFYSGKEKKGIGTYAVNSEESEMSYVESHFSPKVEFNDLSGNGQLIVFKRIYDGILLDLNTGKERIAFDENTSGYASGLVPMDFPRFPAFWGSHIMSYDGTKILLSGIPEGKKSPEIYLLSFEAIQ